MSRSMAYNYVNRQRVIKTTPAFDKKAKKLMSDEAVEELFDHLLEKPQSGDVIKEAGGIRKLRWKTGKGGKGKRGGVRILYSYINGLIILIITMYAKNNKEDISQQEKKELRLLMPKLIEKYTEGLK